MVVPMRFPAAATAASCLLLGALTGFPAAASASFSLADLAADGVPVESAQSQQEPWGILSGIARESAGAALGGPEAALSRTFEAAGIAVDLPAPLDTMGVPGVFAIGSYGDLFVALTQADHDFAEADGQTALDEYLAGEAAEGFATYTAELADGTPVFGCTRETDGLMAMEVYLTAADGSLATLWLEYPVDQGEEYIELSASIYESLRRAPVPAATSLQDGEAAEADGIRFSTAGLAYDEAAGVWADADETLVVASSPSLLLRQEAMGEDRFLDEVASLADGNPVARCVMATGDGSDLLYIVCAVDEGGMLETIAFAVLDDGTATLLYGLCEATDALACERMGSILRSVEVVPQAPAGVVGSLLEHIGTRSVWGGARGANGGGDLSSLLYNPAFVGAAKKA